MRQLLRRVWYAIRKRQFEVDLAEEMAFHGAMKQREIEARGVDSTEATFAARRALGSIALAQDRSITTCSSSTHWTRNWICRPTPRVMS